MTEQKNPIIAALLSFLVPGWGQVYNGQGYLKGLLYMIAEIIGFTILFVPGFIIWVYSIYNAYKVADSMNKGLIPAGKHVGLLSHILYLVLYFIIVFVYITVLTIVGMLIAFLFFGISSSSITGY